jgi:general secretion pathway protein D
MHPATPGLLTAATAPTQTGDGESPEAVRQKSIELCKRARQAIEAGHLETAESLVSRAESMNASFGWLHRGDTPQKVRRDLGRAVQAKADQRRPSQKVTPSLADEDAQAQAIASQAKARQPAMTAGEPGGVPAGMSLNDPKAQARAYVVKARAEMSRGNLTGATHFYQKAVQAGGTFNPGEDSPAAVLADLQKAGAKITPMTEQQLDPNRLPVAADLPGGRQSFPNASPFGKPTISAPPEGQQLAPAFLREMQAQRMAAGGTPSATPVGAAQTPPGMPATLDGMTAGAAPLANAGGNASASGAAAPISPFPQTTVAAGNRSQSDQMLLAARRALAAGDLRRAAELAGQAKALAVRYEFHEDNPTKVEAAIYKCNELQQRPAQERGSESYRRRYAELQMQQAEDLLRWREFDEAERLVSEAQRLGLNYGPFESSPEMLLKRIAESRQRAPAAGRIEPLPKVTEAPAIAQVPSDPPGFSLAAKKSRTLALVKQARAALAAGDLERANQLAEEAQALGVPDSAFGKQDDRPFLVMLQLQKARRDQAKASEVVPAQAVTPIATGAESEKSAVQQAVYDPTTDATQNMPAGAKMVSDGDPSPKPPAGTPKTSALPAGVALPVDGAAVAAGSETVSHGMQLFIEGEEALRRRDTRTALMLFKEAQKFRTELDPTTQQRLQDHLQLASQSAAATAGSGAVERLPLLPATPGATAQAPASTGAVEGSLMKEAAAAEQLKIRQVSADIARQENLVKQTQATDPKAAKLALVEARDIVQKSPLSQQARDALLRRIDRDERELDEYVAANLGKIELNERNDKVRKQMDHERSHKVEVQEKIAMQVEEFNKLVGEQRYDEAEVVAKRLKELAPKEPVVTQINLQAKQLRRMRVVNDTRSDMEEYGFVATNDVLNAAWGKVSDKTPIDFGDKKHWDDLTKSRLAMMKEHRGRRSEKELEIENRLKTPVSVRFKEKPLTQVLESLATLAQVNMHIDPRGLSEEGVASDTPVTIDLSQDISLKSALSLILEPLHLGYVVKDEVLKITSEVLKEGEVITKTYNVADLVMPIPNFAPNGRMGLSGALADAQASLGVGGSVGLGNGPLAVMASKDGSPTNAVIDPKILAQFNVPNPTNNGGMGGMGMGNGTNSGMNQPIGFGPGGMGGGVQPDFDSLIELITGTIAPQTWTDVGGQGAIKQFATNLSLVISQTQEVHEEIADLLEQLRRLQDLQVTIEVRFITLSDVFYERMGVQFDLFANANAQNSAFGQAYSAGTVMPNGNTAQNNSDGAGNNSNPLRNFANEQLNASNAVTVGLAAPFGTGANQTPTYQQDLTIPFTQSSFTVAAPSNAFFPGYTGPGASGGATLGFAILSDLEAYFFMEAVQDDDRTNIMQAPKVTLFNGQQAFVSDTSQSPFVISVIPVVGDFAAAQQPVIVVLSEGTFLSVQAVVSNDRRFVRLTVVPFFSSIGAVNTFTFTGTSSSTSSSGSDGPSDLTVARNKQTSDTNSGTTVQLPTFRFTTVTTTVSVPDGGTVLLGGIKRLTEERHEDGVPILNKIPYVNRLFTNIGTGRATNSLMMMVTPRIIIQEEEEALLGVQPTQ